MYIKARLRNAICAERCVAAAFLFAAPPTIAPLSLVVFFRDLFRELLGLLLCLRAELLGLVDGSVGALLDLVGGLAKLALGGGKTVLGLELESLLAATHAVLLLVSGRCTPDIQIRDMIRVYILPVLDVTVALGCLSTEVDHVASEKKVVPRLDSHSVAHESTAVTDKSGSHRAGDTVVEVMVSLAFSESLSSEADTMRRWWHCRKGTKRTSRGLSGCP